MVICLRDRFTSMRAEIEKAVELLQDGNVASVEQALALLQNTVFSFSMRVCGQRQDAEDTMQEVLLKSIPQLPKFDSPKALLVWLYKVAKNRCLMSRRKSKFAPAHQLSLEELMPDRKELERFTADGKVNPESFAIRGEQASRLREAVQKLPPPYRIVLVLRDMEGLTDDEVAEITGVRAGTVRVRLHRARLFVRKELMRTWMAGGKKVHAQKSPQQENRPARCKAMFAELSDYLDEKLDDSLCEELERHMAGCQPCQAFIATLRATIEQCRSSRGQFPAPEAAKLRQQLIEKYYQVNAVLSANS
jgi:RNA polymerase sigma-70 factor, ECF subfamily